MSPEVKSYKLDDLSPDPSVPTGFWDPKWEDPEVAAKVSRDAYRRLRTEEAGFESGKLLSADALPQVEKKTTETRILPLLPAKQIEEVGVKVRGSAIGEIFRKYTFGITSVYFHAQAVCLGVDEEGRYYLQTQIGRINGTWGKKGTLVVRFRTAEGDVGGVAWQGELDPPKDVHVLITGQDEAIRESFDELTEVVVEFDTFCPEP